MTEDRNHGKQDTPAAERPPSDARKERLAEQLRANLQRRKQQARARRSGEADRRQGLDPAADKGERD